jgi:alpha-L-arabinofuranosidase
MDTSHIRLHTGFHVGPVDPRVFGGFLEHIGRAVYEGVYDPGSRLSDMNGFRMDVMDALRRLRLTAMRYPGGNYASGFNWMDGIGPADQRPMVLDLAWQSLEPNRFGTDEFMRLSRAMGWTPMLTVNLGTGTPEQARNWVEYCNCPAGTRYADMRARGGNPEPYGVRLWCLGNEMDGPWQLGHVPADQYAIRAQQAAKMMKDTDRHIECVVCGSCTVDLPTYMEWDRQVLEYLGDYADYISLHRYVGDRGNDTEDYLAVSNAVDRQIEDIDAVCRYVQARRKSAKRAYLSFDEWNVWYKNSTSDGRGKLAPHLVEEVYDLQDALVVAGFLNSFLRHADCVKIANIAQIVNVIAPILTDGDRMLIQSIFYPFEMYAKRREGVSLGIQQEGPTYAGRTNGTAALIDASAILDGDRLSVFLVNRHPSKQAPVVIEPSDCRITAVQESDILTGPGPKAANSFEQPRVVCVQPFDGFVLRGGRASAKLPPLSVTATTFTIG